MIEKLNLREVENGALGTQSTVVEGASLGLVLGVGVQLGLGLEVGFGLGPAPDLILYSYVLLFAMCFTAVDGGKR